MAVASARFPFGFSVHSNRKVDISSSEFPLNVDVSRISLYPSSLSSTASKGSVGRICARPNIDDFSWEKLPTPMLDAIDNPLCLKNLSLKELKQLASEIRLELSLMTLDERISFEAGLAVVELRSGVPNICT